MSQISSFKSFVPFVVYEDSIEKSLAPWMLDLGINMAL